MDSDKGQSKTIPVFMALAFTLVIVIVVFQACQGASIKSVGIPKFLQIEWFENKKSASAGSVEPPNPTSAIAVLTSGITIPTFPPQATPSGTPIALSGCVVRVTSTLGIRLMDRPREQGTLIGMVKAGQYDAKYYQKVPFAGREEIWFQVRAEGKDGWIVYRGSDIEFKSPPCP